VENRQFTADFVMKATVVITLDFQISKE
jgi:hypothetical protein